MAPLSQGGRACHTRGFVYFQYGNAVSIVSFVKSFSNKLYDKYMINIWILNGPFPEQCFNELHTYSNKVLSILVLTDFTV